MNMNISINMKRRAASASTMLEYVASSLTLSKQEATKWHD